MPEVSLQRSRIVTSVRQREAAGVPEYVRCTLNGSRRRCFVPDE